MSKRRAVSVRTTPKEPALRSVLLSAALVKALESNLDLQGAPSGGPMDGTDRAQHRSTILWSALHFAELHQEEAAAEFSRALAEVREIRAASNAKDAKDRKGGAGTESTESTEVTA